MEKIDLYNSDKQKLDKIFIRGKDKLLDNEYYLLEQVWIINSDNKILLTRRAFDKSYGGMWDAISGHVKSGETDLEAVQREVSEELNLNIEKNEFKFIKSLIFNQTILDVWIVRKNIELEDLNLKDDEVIDAKFVSIEDFQTMLNNKELISRLSYFVDIYKGLGGN